LVDGIIDIHELLPYNICFAENSGVKSPQYNHNHYLVTKQGYAQARLASADRKRKQAIKYRASCQAYFVAKPIL